ncbi:hypothetical protein B0I35DRAFT_479562 [Stachybotrys elegans]|uniref:Uncharacterized protein n=1 Tax=Stachybotrys elegans TaxID=80388 RepID=A0A8K0ST82_9HYPO|nr:hypothetical protein B0I35DRAFT_479562 [Stachybotrys elegans]
MGRTRVKELDFHGKAGINFTRPLTATADGKMHASYEIGFDGGFGLVHREPVHEDMAIAAFIASKFQFPIATTYKNLDRTQWEFIRGLIWNDDPSCLLFKNSTESNCEFDGLGEKFGLAFKFGSRICMTQRSHFGDLQFLHCMASCMGEDARVTRDRAIAWFEVMYKLAIGQGVTENDRLAEKFPGDFHASSEPNGDSSLRDLLLGTTPAYSGSDIPRRALGSCLHLIQDSYAVGHTLRRLLNPEDLEARDDKSYARFKPGTYAKLGSIITFHTYAGQSNRHGHYDESPDQRDPGNSNTFNQTIGARDAIEKCTKLLDLYVSKTKWEDGVADLIVKEVLALDDNATTSDSQVDERFGMPDTSNDQKLPACENSWHSGVEKRMDLESGLTCDERGDFTGSKQNKY